MTLRIKLPHLAAGIVLGALLVSGGYAIAMSRNTVIHACVNLRTRALIVPADHRCRRGYADLSWNRQGPRGRAGSRGRAGVTGPGGSPAMISVGSVTTEPPGSQAKVTNSGSGSNAILNFGLPQGAAGANATNPGPTAYGEVWMGGGSNSAKLATGALQANVAAVGDGDGTAVVGVSGCSAAGLTEPVITVTANHDPSDPLLGADSAGTAGAYVTGWSASNSVLTFSVSTYNATNGMRATSDFSFTVYC